MLPIELGLVTVHLVYCRLQKSKIEDLAEFIQARKVTYGRAILIAV